MPDRGPPPVSSSRPGSAQFQVDDVAPGVSTISAARGRAVGQRDVLRVVDEAFTVDLALARLCLNRAAQTGRLKQSGFNRATQTERLQQNAFKGSIAY